MMTSSKLKFRQFSLTLTTYTKVAHMLNRLIYLLFTQPLQRYLRKPEAQKQSKSAPSLINRTFDLSRQEDRDYLNGLKTTYMAGVNTSDTEGNETDRALSSQLILI